MGFSDRQSLNTSLAWALLEDVGLELLVESSGSFAFVKQHRNASVEESMPYGVPGLVQLTHRAESNEVAVVGYMLLLEVLQEPLVVLKGQRNLQVSVRYIQR